MLKPHGQWDIREHNIWLTLNTIRQNGRISRAELAKKTGLSAASLTRIIAPLTKQNLITEKNAEKSGEKGRLATITSINSGAFFCVCIAINKNEITVGLMDFGRRFVRVLSEEPYFMAATPDGIFKQANELYKQLLKDCGVQKKEIKAAGVSCTGAVSREYKKVLFCADFCWTDAEIELICMDAFGLRCVVENDVKAALIGEKELFFQDRRNIAYLKIDGEMECASICDGHLLIGNKNMAGMVGHVSYKSNGDSLCGCGRRDCLNSYISKSNLLKQARKYEHDILNLDDVMAAYKLEMPWAVEIEQTVVQSVAQAINNCICMYNPEILVIGGQFAKRYPFVVKEACELGENSLYRAMAKDTEIVPARGDSLTGIGILAQENVLQEMFQNGI